MILPVKLEPDEQQKAVDLQAAGWSAKVGVHVWRSPQGKLFGGLNHAWRTMIAQHADAETK